MPGTTDANGVASGGSQLQTQLYVNKRTDRLDAAIREAFPDLQSTSFEWVSPIASKGYAEYYGSSFLKALGMDAHTDSLKDFWPARGPQWDALALVRGLDDGVPGVLLVEGKSYPNEMLRGSATTSEPGTENRDRIDASLAWARKQLGVSHEKTPEWTGQLYQNANRLAHLLWLQQQGVQAWLVHLLFTGDPIQPTTTEQWEAAVREADDRLGIPSDAVPGAGHVTLEAGQASELTA